MANFTTQQIDEFLNKNKALTGRGDLVKMLCQDLLDTRMSQAALQDAVSTLKQQIVALKSEIRSSEAEPIATKADTVTLSLETYDYMKELQCLAKEDMEDLRAELDSVYEELAETNRILANAHMQEQASEDSQGHLYNVANLREALADWKHKYNRIHASQEECNIRACRAESKVIKLQKEVDLKNRVIENLTSKRDEYKVAAVKLRETLAFIQSRLWPAQGEAGAAIDKSLEKTDWIK